MEIFLKIDENYVWKKKRKVKNGKIRTSMSHQNCKKKNEGNIDFSKWILQDPDGPIFVRTVKVQTSTIFMSQYSMLPQTLH